MELMDKGLLIYNSSTIFFFFGSLAQYQEEFIWLIGYLVLKKKINYANICEEKNELPLYKLDGCAF